MSNDDITVGRLHTISTNHAKTYGKKNKGNTYYCTYTSTPDSYRTQKLQRECHPRCKRATGPTHVRPIIIVKPRGGKNVSKETITGDVQCHNISTRVYAGRFPTRCRHPPPPSISSDDKLTREVFYVSVLIGSPKSMRSSRLPRIIFDTANTS